MPVEKNMDFLAGLNRNQLIAWLQNGEQLPILMKKTLNKAEQWLTLQASIIFD
jgi:hypothetical protein